MKKHREPEMHSGEERVELHLHTSFSQMDALTDVSELMKRVSALGCAAVAITDHGNVQAFPEAQKAADKHGVKVIYGMEGHYYDDTMAESENDHFHIILLVKDRDGLKNLYKLVSYANMDGFSKVPRIPRSILDKHRCGLMIGSACVCGELFQALLNGKAEDELLEIAAYYDYIEIHPVCNDRFLIGARGISSDDDLRRLNLRIAGIADKLNKPLVATGDVHFLDPEEEVARSILLSARGVENPDAPLPLYFKSTEEMLGEFAYLGEAAAYRTVVTNTRVIADSIGDVAPIPSGVYLPEIDGAEQEVESRSIARAESIYGCPLPEPVRERLDWELSAIRSYGFEIYYAIAERLVKKSGESGYAVGARGSVASSLVACLLGITEINPLRAHYVCTVCKHSDFKAAARYDTGFDMPDLACPVCGRLLKKDGFNIPVETLLGDGGNKAPDIDLNFSGEYVAQARDHLKEIFGRDHVVLEGMIGAMSERMAHGYIERYADDHDLELTGEEIDSIARSLTGIKRISGRRPGGCIIVPRNMEVTDFCPVDKTDDGIVTHFDYHSMNGCLIKMDVLGHGTPTLLHGLEELTGVSQSAVPPDDAPTMRLFTTANTVGLPEFDSDFARGILEMIKPDCFSDLIKLSGMLHAAGAWEGNAKRLIREGEASLKDTVSLRDEVFLYLRSRGMPHAEAYRLMEFVRKGMFYTGPGAWNGAAHVEKRREWERRLQQYDVPGWYIDSLKKIQYLFPKAQAATYVMQSYRVAWYKAHYPAEFCVAMMNEADANGSLEETDLLKAPSALKDEIGRLKLLCNDGWHFGGDHDCERKKVLEIICEAYDRGIRFVPYSARENRKNGKKFAMGANSSIRVSEAYMGGE
ncbi:MAG: PHP domain-containing protein [Bacillota bacterium]|nr:PHP domain-containing protein [Bacillota bacterium]